MHFSQLSRSFRAKPSAHCKYISQPERPICLREKTWNLGLAHVASRNPTFLECTSSYKSGNSACAAPDTPPRAKDLRRLRSGWPGMGGEAADTARARGVVAGGGTARPGVDKGRAEGGSRKGDRAGRGSGAVGLAAALRPDSTDPGRATGQASSPPGPSPEPASERGGAAR